MKLESITLTNFRSHVSSAIKGLGAINIFVGSNGAGKSTILDAISYAMTGVCRGVDEGGRGADGLTSQLPSAGKASASVALGSGTDQIIRAVGQGPRSQAHIKIVTKLGLDERVLRAIAAPLNLLRLPPKKQEELFFLLTGSSVNKEQVFQALGGLGPTSGQHLEALTTPAGRENTLAYFKTRRVELKRAIATLVVPESVAGTFDADVLAEDEKTLADWRTELATARGAHDSAARLAKDIEDQIARTSAYLTGVNSDSAAGLLSASEQTAIRASLRHHQMMKDSVGTLNQQVRDICTRAKAMREEAERLAGLKAECPTCSQKVSKKFVTERVKELNAAAEPLDQEARELTGKAGLIQKDLSSIDPDELNRKLVESARAEERMKANRERKAQLDEELKDLARRKAALPKVEELDFKGAEANIAELQKKVEALRAAKAEMDQAKTINSKRSDLEAELVRVEAMVKAIGPGGPVAALMASDGTTEMVQRVRDIGAKLGIGDLAITPSPWRITLNGRSVELASASEEFRIAAAFGIAFANKAGASLVCLDGAEILFGEFRDMFQGLLFECGIEQVFVAATVDELPKMEESVPGLAMYSVTKGADGASVVAPILPGVKS